MSTVDQLEKLESRVQQLESKLAEFDLKVKVLKWAAGGLLTLIAALGLSIPKIVTWVWSRQKNEILSPMQAEITASERTEAELKAEQAAASQVHAAPTNSATEGPGPAHAHTAPAHILRPYTPKTRTGRQIAGMAAMLSQPMSDSSNATEFVPYIGQLTNCVTVFISDLEAHNVGPSYNEGNSAAIYQEIFGLAGQLRAEIRMHDKSPKEWDRAWHSEGWFNGFLNALTDMESQHQRLGTLPDDQLDKWKENFIGIRNGFMVFTGSWPQPFDSSRSTPAVGGQ